MPVGRAKVQKQSKRGIKLYQLFQCRNSSLKIEWEPNYIFQRYWHFRTWEMQMWQIAALIDHGKFIEIPKNKLKHSQRTKYKSHFKCVELKLLKQPIFRNEY